jgi:hypothetical protein
MSEKTGRETIRPPPNFCICGNLNASEAHFRQHYGLSHLEDLYQRTANKGVGGWSAARLWFIRGNVLV